MHSMQHFFHSKSNNHCDQHNDDHINHTVSLITSMPLLHTGPTLLNHTKVF